MLFLCRLHRSVDTRLLFQMIPADHNHLGTEKYNGVFHARFWHFGDWINVFIDDQIPVFRDTR